MSRNRTVRPPTARERRGLAWIESHAHADFEAIQDERGTGAFAGTSRPEILEAFAFLDGLIYTRSRHTRGTTQ